MAKKPSLQSALLDASSKTTAAPAPVRVVAGGRAKPARDTTPGVRRDRAATRVVSGHFDAAVQKQLRQMALDGDTTVQALLGEALNDLFTKHKRKPIA